MTIECLIPLQPTDCFALRQAVFCEEQGFVHEFDEFDHHPHTVHTLLMAENEPVGCARYLIEFDHEMPYLRVGRIAIQASMRGKGLGRELMERSLPLARTHLASVCPNLMKHVNEVRLHSQADKVGFYERCGFTAMDVPPDEEEGVAHQWMSAKLS